MTAHTAGLTAPPQPANKPGFRLDIEGLRGLAILLVVLGHVAFTIAGIELHLHGGVDISFVLSGFLVTWLLLREQHKNGKIAFGKFYARRARRLMPAATLVTLATLVGAWVWMSPLRLATVGADGLAAAMSLINYRLASLATDYFSDKAPSPFQHFWSLSVEEQFYLLWPALLLGALWLGNRFGRGRQMVSVLLTLVVVVSLSLSVITTHTAQPWAYFGFHTRAWELAAGALVAVAAQHLARLPKLLAAALSWLGLAVIAASAVLITEDTPLPGYAVAGPVVGAALVIAGGCANPHLGAERLLTVPALRYCGRISYAWYLWHWPILVIMPEMTGHALTGPDKFTVVVSSFGLAAVTFHLLEKPIREHKPLVQHAPFGLVLGFGLVAVSVVASIFVAIIVPPQATSAQTIVAQPAKPVSEIERLVAEGAKLDKMPPEMSGAANTALTDGLDNCINLYEVTQPKPCVIGDKSSATTMVLVGDSHATHWKPALGAIAKKHRIRLVTYAKSKCTPEPYSNIDYNTQRRYVECEKWRENVFREVEEVLRPKAVILSSAIYDGASGQAAYSIVHRFVSRGTRVVVFDDTPRPFVHIPQCLSKYPENVQKCAIPRTTAMYKPELRDARMVNTVKAGGHFIHLDKWFCTAAVCPPVINGMVVYMDMAHITATYVRWLTPELEKKLKPILN